MIVFDTESDGLLDEATRLHCLNLVDRTTGARERYNDQPEISRGENYMGTIAEGVERLKRAYEEGQQIAGQNVLKHDIPIIRKLVDPDFTIHPDKVTDTLIISQLIWTDLGDIDRRALKKGRRPKEFKDRRLTGSHGLEAWGWRLGDYKGDYFEMRKAQGKELGLEGAELDHFIYGIFTADMDDYCAQDVEVTCKLLEKIEREEYAEEAIRLEHRVAEIIFLQERFGVYFDVPAAEKLAVHLTAEKADLEDQLRSAFKPWFKPVIEKGRVVVMDPKVRRNVTVEGPDGETWKASYEPGAPFTKVKLVSFEPGSRDMIADRLKTLFGWIPTEFTPKGKPEVSETTLGGLDYPEAKLLIRYLTISKLLATVATGQKAWLRKVDDDGRIRSRVKTNGAVTGRMTHADHLAQVNKVKVDEDGNKLLGWEGRYGVESRSLFIAPPGKKLVGVDGEGLELRMLGHYMARFDGGAYASAVVDGDKKLGTDAHTLNMKAVGLRTRDGAKTWIYAYLYGAGNLKLGMIHYEDMTEEWRDEFNREHPAGGKREKALMDLGQTGRKRIEKGFPALAELQKDVKAAAKYDGQVRSFDGRMINIRAQHSALNTLLQGGGAVVMKKALVLAYDDFLERGWRFGNEFAFVLNVHDEFQMEVLPDYAEEIGPLAADAIRRAGEEFGLRCPLSGSSDVGQTWADTH